METAKIHTISNMTRYQDMLKPKLRMASILRLAGLISKKEAKKMLETSKKARVEWR